MKIIVIICMIVAHCLATKEKITDDDIYSMLNDQEILKEIVKRLEGNDVIPSPQKKSHPPIPENSNLANIPSDTDQCRTHAFEGKIIRTGDSLDAGAVYLGSIVNMESNEACVHRCCSSSKGCDLAVYENKTKHNCFLFQCRNKTTGQNMCLFDKLDAYISTTASVIPDNGQTSSSGEAISDLKHGPGTNSKSSEQKQPVPVETTPRPSQLPHSVALENTCSSDLSCEDPHAACVDTQCQCRQNFYRRNRVCREVCGNDEMECMSRGTSRRGPDCIPKSQVCDGTTQCADGSDERDCVPEPVVGNPAKPWQRKPRPGHPNGGDYRGMGYGYDLQNMDSPKNEQDLQELEQKSSNNFDSQRNGDEDSSKSVESGYNQIKPDYPYSSSVDKQLEAVTAPRTELPRAKPTVRPTNPGVSWYTGEETEKSSNVKNRQPVHDKERTHRVDTTIEDTGNRVKDVIQDPKNGVDQTNVRPRPTQNAQSMSESLQSELPKPSHQTVPSQDLPKTTYQEKTFKATASSDVPDLRVTSGDQFGSQGYPPFDNRGYISHGQGNQDVQLKPNAVPDIADYDSNYYGMGQQKPFQRHYPPSRQNGKFHKVPGDNYNHNNFNYNYDYNDYDSYVPYQGPDFRRPFGRHDAPNYQQKPLGGDYPNGNRHGPGYDLQQPPVSDNTQDQGLPGGDSSLTDSSELPHEDKDKSQTDVEDSSKELRKPPLDDKKPLKKIEVPGNLIQEQKPSSDEVPQEKEQIQTESPKHTSSENSLKAHTSAVKTTASTKPAKKPKVPVKKTGDHHDAYVVKEVKGEGFITKKKVYVATDGAQGPIVALSLGLAFTLMLLVFVGCRLRNVRRRLRKGRPLHSNEADYLINGMYL